MPDQVEVAEVFHFDSQVVATAALSPIVATGSDPLSVSSPCPSRADRRIYSEPFYPAATPVKSDRGPAEPMRGQRTLQTQPLAFRFGVTYHPLCIWEERRRQPPARGGAPSAENVP